MSVFSDEREDAPRTAREHRDRKRVEAVERDARTRPERRRKARQKCPTGKRVIPSEEEARAELVGTIIRANRGNARRKECRFYQCPECSFWHLTSQPFPAKENRS